MIIRPIFKTVGSIQIPCQSFRLRHRKTLLLNSGLIFFKSGQAGSSLFSVSGMWTIDRMFWYQNWSRLIITHVYSKWGRFEDTKNWVPQKCRHNSPANQLLCPLTKVEWQMAFLQSENLQRTFSLLFAKIGFLKVKWFLRFWTNWVKLLHFSIWLNWSWNFCWILSNYATLPLKD